MTHRGEIERIDTIHGPFFSAKGDMVSGQLKTYSAHTRNELSMILSFVSEGDHVIDVGAHIGTFCIPLSRCVGDSGKVYAFEGDPDNYELLRKNIRENGKEHVIDAYLGVVTDQRGAFRKVVPNELNSMSKYFINSEGFDDGSEELNSIHIDDWFYRDPNKAPISLIKIDTEGYEVNVLQSCRRLIEAYKPIIYCEVNRSTMKRFDMSPDGIEKILGPQGYHFFRNIGNRNSKNDRFVLARLRTLNQKSSFDVLAVHPSGDRYPKTFKKSIWVDIHNRKAKAHTYGRKILRNLRIIRKPATVR